MSDPEHTRKCVPIGSLRDNLGVLSRRCKERMRSRCRTVAEWLMWSDADHFVYFSDSSGTHAVSVTQKHADRVICRYRGTSVMAADIQDDLQDAFERSFKTLAQVVEKFVGHAA